MDFYWMTKREKARVDLPDGCFLESELIDGKQIKFSVGSSVCSVRTIKLGAHLAAEEYKKHLQNLIGKLPALDIIARVDGPMLAALSKFVAKDDARYYLYGIQIIPATSGDGVMMFATNGHALLCAHDPYGYVSEDCILQFDTCIFEAVERNVLDTYVDVSGGIAAVLSASDTHTHLVGGPGELIRSSSIRQSAKQEDVVACFGQVTTIDGRYPTIENAVPSGRSSRESVTINPALLKLLEKAGKAARIYGFTGKIKSSTGGISLGFPQKESGGLIVRYATGCERAGRMFGVLMPMRNDSSTEPCDWWKEHLHILGLEHSKQPEPAKTQEQHHESLKENLHLLSNTPCLRRLSENH